MFTRLARTYRLSYLSPAARCLRQNAHYLYLSAPRLVMPSKSKDDLDGPTFDFPEEPLGLPADSTCGFFQGGPGDSLGPSGRYSIQAKLGYGVGSNVWLAKDNKQGSYVSLKILSGYTTRLNREDKLRELVALQRLAISPVEEPTHSTRLLDHFYYRGMEEDGEHLCLVLRLEQATLRDTWDETKGLPVPVVKRIVNHVLQGLSALHGCGIAHTDLKPDNIMIAMSPRLTSEALSDWVDAHPPRVYAGVKSLNKTITKAFVTEKLPPPSMEDLARCTFRLGDVSHAQIVGDQTTDDITPLTLRPPEVMLGGVWDQSVDMWTLGALVFTLLTGKHLFSESIRDHHRQFLHDGVSNASSVEEVLFWQIATFTGQRYPPAVLELYPLSERYFERHGQYSGMLKSFRYVSYPLEKTMRDAGFAGSDSDLAGACALMRRCLQINPSARPSAQALLANDTWLTS